jgi:hypothetical protein
MAAGIAHITAGKRMATDFCVIKLPTVQGNSHGGTEAPVTTGRAARAAKKKVVAENMGPLLLALLDVGASV